MAFPALFMKEGGRKQMLKKGKELDEFYHALDLSSKTMLCVPNGKTTINATLEYRGKTLNGWKVTTRNETGAVKPVRKGKRYIEFIKFLKTQDKEETMFRVDQNDAVLCYRDTESEDNGCIVTNWFMIDPGFPFVIAMDGQPKFKILKTSLNAWEYDRMMETRLAFIHDGILYPITKYAIRSVGALLDSTAAFKTLDDCQLGAALLIAEKFSRSRELKFIYRECTDKVRPIYAVGGTGYKHMNLVEFFRTAVSKIPGIYTLMNWKVTDVSASAKFNLMENPDYRIVIEAGDMPGRSISVTAYYRISGCEVPIKCNLYNHKGEINEKAYSILFDGIGESINHWQDMKLYAPYTKGMLKGLKKIIGQKRSEKLDLSGLKNFNGWDLIAEIIRRTNMHLPSRQKELLCWEYNKMILKMEEMQYGMEKHSEIEGAV